MLLPRLEGDLLEALAAAARGEPRADAAARAAATPPSPSSSPGPTTRRAATTAGAAIDGIAEAEAAGALVFHGGTALRDGRARHERRPDPLRDRRSAPTVAEARERAYAAVERGERSTAHALPHRHRARRLDRAMAEPLVGILVGSESDRERMQAALDELDARGIAWEFEVRSAHRTPDAVAEYARSARERGPARADLRRRPRRGAARRRRRAHRAAGDRRAAALVDERPRRPRRAALDRPDAARRAGRDGRASTTRRTPPCSRRGSSASAEPRRAARLRPPSLDCPRDRPLLPARDEPDLVGGGQAGALARRRARGARRLGRGRRDPRRGRRGDPRAARPPTPERVAEIELTTDHDIAAFVDAVAEQLGPGGPLGALRAHLVRRRRHRARAADPGRGRLVLAGLDRALDAVVARAPRSTAARSASAARTASTPSRRRSAGSSPAGRSSSTATATRARARARVEPRRPALRHGRHLRGARPRGRADRLRAARPRAGPALDAGDRARPARRAALGARARRDVARALRDRDPPPRAHRGARGRGAVRARA